MCEPLSLRRGLRPVSAGRGSGTPFPRGDSAAGSSPSQTGPQEKAVMGSSPQAGPPSPPSQDTLVETPFKVLGTALIPSWTTYKKFRNNRIKSQAQLSPVPSFPCRWCPLVAARTFPQPGVPGMCHPHWLSFCSPGFLVAPLIACEITRAQGRRVGMETISLTCGHTVC